MQSQISSTSPSLRARRRWLTNGQVTHFPVGIGNLLQPLLRLQVDEGWTRPASSRDDRQARVEAFKEKFKVQAWSFFAREYYNATNTT